MMTFTIFLYFFAILWIGQSSYVGFTCTSRFGPSIFSGLSTVQCAAGETMVSCGIKGTQAIGGTSIDDATSTCIAESRSAVWSVEAVARCCVFPSGAVVSVSNPETAAAQTPSLSCPATSELTGCQPRYATGGADNIRGAYSGAFVSSLSGTGWIDTLNTCQGSYKTSGTITLGASCVELDEGYELECETKRTYTSTSGFGTCDTGYTMMSCTTYTNSGTLDSYYVDTNDRCYIQQDGHAPMYANAICCRLKKDACVAYGLSLNTPHDCQCSSQCDGFYCNKIGFVEGRLQVPSTTQTLCEGTDTCCCNCPNCGTQ